MSSLLTMATASLRLLSLGARRRFEATLRDPAGASAFAAERLLGLAGRPTFPSEPTDATFWMTQRIPSACERTLFFETTSGTSGAKKRIPYTTSQLRGFRRMFLLWADDLLRNAPVPLESGRTFMSISPKIGSEALGDDSEYLGLGMRLLLAPFLAADPRLQSAPDSESFFRAVALALLERRDLEVLSLWSPSYFLSLLSWIEMNRADLSVEVRSKTARAALEKSTFDASVIWPRLKWISCWSDGSSRPSAERLGATFPGAWMQGKGLLATEGVVSIPWIQAGGCVPFQGDFLCEILDDRGSIRPVHSLREGESAEILLSAPNGWHRVRLGDRVISTGRFLSVPLLEFLGRAGRVSDLVGEKLDDQLVRDALAGWTPERLRLLPISGVGAEAYVLLHDLDVEPGPQDLDARLRTIHHYRLARDLRQLREPRIQKVPGLTGLVADFLEREGIRRGDQKESVLIDSPERARRLLEFVQRPRARRLSSGVIAENSPPRS